LPCASSATALAPTALEAEIRAKAALLAGPRSAAGWLPHGGVIVFDDGSHEVVAPAGATQASNTTASPWPTPMHSAATP
jgi:FAD:protein FMN transferase